MGMLCFLHFNDQRLVLRIILSYWQTHSLTKSLLPQPYTIYVGELTDFQCHHRLTIYRRTLSPQTYILSGNWQTFTLSTQTYNLLGNWQTYTVTTDLHSVGELTDFYTVTTDKQSVGELTDLHCHHRLTLCQEIDRLKLSPQTYNLLGNWQTNTVNIDLQSKWVTDRLTIWLSHYQPRLTLWLNQCHHKLTFWLGD